MTIQKEVGGYTVLLDECDEHLLSGSRSWQVSKFSSKRYVRRTSTESGTRETLFLHRLIIGARKGEFVDHINGNPLDNRRENLRIVTVRQNNLNAVKIAARKTASRFKGVSWNRGRWVARIRVEGKHLTLGRFDDQAEAAMAYDIASTLHHGEYGRRNFYPLMN